MSASQVKLRELARELELCSDEDELDACVESYRDIIKQAWLHNEDWYFANQSLIDRRRAEIRSEEKERIRYGFNY